MLIKFNLKSGIIYITLFFFLFIENGLTKELNRSKNLYGVPGIVDMPVAGSFDDGEINFSSAKTNINLRNTFGFQALPNVFGAFRYAGIGDKQYYYIDSGYTTWDRSFDLRLDLIKENKLIPDVTVGFQDIIGTGIYSTEYLVASKNILNFLRTTIGLGWGRLGTANIIDNGQKRPDNTGGKRGGLLRYKQIFKGSIGVFGGLELKTPVNDLQLKVEVSSDSYDKEHYLINNPISSNINYGFDYTVNNNLSLSGYYVYGNEVGVQVNLSANPLNDSTSSFLEGTPQPFYSIPNPELNDPNKYWENVISDLKQEEITTIGYKHTKNEAIIVIQNFHYTTHTQAIGRTLRILSRHVPISKSKFTVVLSDGGLPVTKITIDRNETSLIIDAPNAELLSKKLVKISSAPRVINDIKVKEKNPIKLDWSLGPYYRLHLFDPSKPLYHDFGASLKLLINPKPGITFQATIEEPLETNFDEIWRGTKGRLPKVRTDLRKYLNVTDTRIKDLMGTSYFKLSKDIYGRLSAGYFEMMYSGLSTEILYAPNKHSVAIGAEANYLEARDYRQLLGNREIEGLSKLNGHLSGYWDTGYYDYLAQLDVGRYIAGDDGGTITMSRNFPNGWIVGGFFTLTNATFDDFGEGSFDKGLFLRIPFSSILPYETRYGLIEKVRPIQGDGGAKLAIQGRLYPLISQYSKNKLNSSWGKIWR